VLVYVCVFVVVCACVCGRTGDLVFAWLGVCGCVCVGVCKCV
jgi:hypothetical protein